ncbi:MAG: hypothetical protein PVF65_10255 [Sphingomonadales bacterium]|jgi:hypothetical protein
MGKALSFQIWLSLKSLSYSYAVVLLLWQPALAASDINITPALTFTPGSGFLTNYDKERLYFEFQRTTPCPPNNAGAYSDALCRNYWKDIYHIDPFSNSIALISSDQLMKKEVLPSGLSTESKHIDIIDRLRATNSETPILYESINIGQGLHLNVFYYGAAPNIRTRIEFTTTEGKVLYKDRYGLISIHETLLMTEDESPEKQSIMLEIRWCGASSCQGQLQFYSLNRNDHQAIP